MKSTVPLACFLSIIRPPGVQFENALLQLAPVDKSKCPFIKDKNDVGFQLFTRHNPTVYQELAIDDDEKLFASNIDLNDRTVLYFHAFMEQPDDGSGIMIREALMQRGDTNVIMVDASRLEAGPWYFTAAHNTWYIGQFAARFVDYLVTRGLNLNTTHFIGHSLGAQAAGVVGGHLKTGRVARITGLDPALPLFDHVSLEERLDQGDAHFVDVIHTDAGIFGFPASIGHADFYPNGGKSPQPGCELEIVIPQHLLLNKSTGVHTNSTLSQFYVHCLLWQRLVPHGRNIVAEAAPAHQQRIWATASITSAGYTEQHLLPLHPQSTHTTNNAISHVNDIVVDQEQVRNQHYTKQRTKGVVTINKDLNENSEKHANIESLHMIMRNTKDESNEFININKVDEMDSYTKNNIVNKLRLHKIANPDKSEVESLRYKNNKDKLFKQIKGIHSNNTKNIINKNTNDNNDNTRTIIEQYRAEHKEHFSPLHVLKTTHTPDTVLFHGIRQTDHKKRTTKHANNKDFVNYSTLRNQILRRKRSIYKDSELHEVLNKASLDCTLAKQRDDITRHVNNMKVHVRHRSQHVKAHSVPSATLPRVQKPPQTAFFNNPFTRDFDYKNHLTKQINHANYIRYPSENVEDHTKPMLSSYKAIKYANEREGHTEYDDAPRRVISNNYVTIFSKSFVPLAKPPVNTNIFSDDKMKKQIYYNNLVTRQPYYNEKITKNVDHKDRHASDVPQDIKYTNKHQAYLPIHTSNQNLVIDKFYTQTDHNYKASRHIDYKYNYASDISKGNNVVSNRQNIQNSDKILLFDKLTKQSDYKVTNHVNYNTGHTKDNHSRRKRFVPLPNTPRNALFGLFQLFIKNKIPLLTFVREINTIVKSTSGDINNYIRESYIGHTPQIPSYSYNLETGGGNRLPGLVKKFLGFGSGDRFTISAQ